jgi:hypothetical protein
MLRALRLRCPWALAAALAPLAGCTYTSDYVPPQDGRARPIWSENEVVASLPAADPSCLEETTALAAGQSPRVYVRGGRTVVYGGPTIVVWAPPVVRVHGASGSTRTHGSSVARRTATPTTPTTHAASRSPQRHGAGNRGNDTSSTQSSQGKGNPGAELVAALAVIAILAMPAITLSIALTNPGADKQSARAVDTVNAYNDLTRTGGTPCSMPMVDEEMEP